MKFSYIARPLEEKVIESGNLYIALKLGSVKGKMIAYDEVKKGVLF
ncbi:MAG: hypothetical protein ACK5MV_12600 [Aminipila sp.]